MSRGRSPWRRVECVVVTAVLLFAMTLPGTAEEPDRLNAILLVARPQVADDNFAESVVLVMNILGPAPVGIIVNRPTRVSVSQLVPDKPRIARLSRSTSADRLTSAGSGFSFGRKRLRHSQSGPLTTIT